MSGRPSLKSEATKSGSLTVLTNYNDDNRRYNMSVVIHQTSGGYESLLKLLFSIWNEGKPIIPNAIPNGWERVSE
jgi:hypothetical protein